MATVEVKVPDIGDFKDVAIIEVLVKPGDQVQKDQSLITVESDKASMEIPSDTAGTVKEMKVKLGDKISQGSVVLTLEVAADAAKPAETKAAAPTTPAPVAAPAASPAAPAASAVAEPINVKVPDIGDFKDVAVIEVLVKPGDEIKVDQSLITVESDKASMEIPSSVAGTLKSLNVKVGDKVNAGDVIAVVQGIASAPQAAASSAAAAPAQNTAVAPSAAVPASASVPAHDPSSVVPGKLPHASPSIRKTARELGVPLAEVKGSGLKGRITLQDLQGFVRGVMDGSVRTQAQAAKGGSGVGMDLLPWPEVDFTKFGEVDRKPLSRIKKISGANLHRNWVMIPHVTNCEDADITELEAFRVQLNKEAEKSKSAVKYTLLAFLIKASVAALKKFPEFNASLQGDELVYKKYFNIGFAADTPNGLVVPVIKNADQKGLADIAAETAALAAKAREGKISPADMSGGCFSISSLGGFGGTYFTPIINAPEVAILGVCRSATRPVWDGKAFQPRLIVPLSLSYDHRVIDGALAARFNAYLSAVLADFRRVLL
ncbi:Dihydrolipoyllysine-residue acetyltransferase component of pyruvate dehydrogenase complex [Saezia sanguinis]|uniref:Acetyltransferase component of pyruvate dehydrogenase complex n=1 Tax=Saezia sanguinis TaxID=1965230 RepID=A0A433SFV2_9BURK|nr:dihydrolipoyllysine-residue acetyltransferase [Saezia sanguinis]RUS67627.1 Dihydrolipoyllysine-residue acetyltransferase component of pyruvate dehydrogenase complex [Saezia sanguinis]